ncbi:MAG: tRNA lysidine(34) synthetase TilS [Rickettsia endosymbiont of Bryobia graminum]|nr:tRNA lysidine(34) synthetase TilS [Rickettsia endosymbiont of Bryobia graminum]
MIYQQFQNNLYHLLDKNITNIAIAVSGGSDSVALLMLAHKWAKDNNVNLIVISIDHNLRQESKIENRYIKNISHKLGYKHYILDFDHQNNFSNLQARARQARYQLMTKLCLKLDVLTLLTAHHLDDYIENYCMRLEKKSSIFGLSNSNINWYNNIRIIRPFFNISKQLLVDYLIENNIKWFEDKSNLSDKYTRNVIRKKLTTEEIYKKDTIINQLYTINNQVNENLQPEFISCIPESARIFDLGFSIIDLSKFAIFSNKIKYQLISFILIIISGKNYSGRSDSINNIVILLQQQTNFTKTLHGCVLKKINKTLIIYREFGRKKPEDIVIYSNNYCTWDNRFTLKINNHNLPKNEKYYISNLTVENYSTIKGNIDLTYLKNLSFNNHITILFTLPAIKILEKVIAIPHLSYYNDNSLREEISVRFTPNFISRFTHFC